MYSLQSLTQPGPLRPFCGDFGFLIHSNPLLLATGLTFIWPCSSDVETSTSTLGPQGLLEGQDLTFRNLNMGGVGIKARVLGRVMAKTGVKGGIAPLLGICLTHDPLI